MKSQMPSLKQPLNEFAARYRSFVKESLEDTDRLLQQLEAQRANLVARRAEIVATLATFDEGARADA